MADSRVRFLGLFAVTALLLALYIGAFMFCIGRSHWLEMQLPAASNCLFDLVANLTVTGNHYPPKSVMNVSVGVDRFCWAVPEASNCSTYEALEGVSGLECAAPYFSAAHVANSLFFASQLCVFCLILVFAGTLFPKVREGAKPPSRRVWMLLVVVLFLVGLSGPVLQLVAICWLTHTWHFVVCGLPVEASNARLGPNFWATLSCYLVSLGLYTALVWGLKVLRDRRLFQDEAPDSCARRFWAFWTEM
eukprot:GGOE01054226.1.p1 GENE.GGOE01054226.1~~GGOE01054226.1.p1  ORF type:complete len:255 (-),score=72.43 GGOE01054226.1:338-1081(-)